MSTRPLAKSLAHLMEPERELGATQVRRAQTVDRMIADLEVLSRLEAEAEEGHARVADLDRWVPTPYEESFLPGLRLAGIEDKQSISLQNSADLHLHTQWSDGDDLDKVLARAVEERLDVIAITDHDVIEGALEARRRVHERRLPIAVVPGIEISSRDGHIGGLYLTRKIPAGLSAEETIRRIHAAGGIAIAHHPYAPRLIEMLLGIKLGCRDLILTLPFDAIECTNAVPGFGTKYNQEAWRKARERNSPLGVTASSDAHTAALVGKARTYFAGNKGVSSLLTSVRHGMTLGGEGYWKTSEKLLFRVTLLKAVIKNLFRRTGSVN